MLQPFKDFFYKESLCSKIMFQAVEYDTATAFPLLNILRIQPTVPWVCHSLINAITIALFIL